MNKILMAVMTVAVLTGCGAIRDKAVYATEVQYVDMTVRYEAATVKRFLTSACTCSGEGVWVASSENSTTEDCASAGDWYRVYSSRWAWHVGMMRYNGRTSDTDPGAIPEIAMTCELPELP